MRVDNGVEGGGRNRMIEGEVGYAKVNVRQFGIDGNGAWDNRNLVKPVGGPEFLGANR
jgi:hypothetical protein